MKIKKVLSIVRGNRHLGNNSRIDRYQLKHGQKSSNGLPFNADIKIMQRQFEAKINKIVANLVNDLPFNTYISRSLRV